jgi:Tfp pilus assembly PilM family ATPase
MANRAVAIDLGSHGGRAIAVKATKHGLAVTRFVSAPAAEAADVLHSSGLSLQGVICGLAGRDMTLRYSQVPPTPDWQLKNLMDLEIQDLAAQSGGALSADYNLLPTQDPEAGVDTVLLALAKDEALQRLQQLAKAAGGTCGGFVPNCVALYNAYLKCGPVEPDTVVCLANIGHETIDIALVKGQDLLFARNLSGGGKVLDDAIAAAFNVSARKAESLKHELLDLDPQSRGRFASGQAEKVTMAAGGAAPVITAGIQS